MIIKDTFSKFTKISKLSGCIAFFTNEKSEITHLKKYLSSTDHKNLNVLLKPYLLLPMKLKSNHGLLVEQNWSTFRCCFLF